MSPSLIVPAIGLWTAIIVGLMWRIARTSAGAIPGGDGDIVRRLIRNSAAPITSQLIIRGMDLMVAVALLRILGPAGNGRYAVSVVVWLYAKTISDFGLSLLATRNVARDHSIAPAVIGDTTIMRWFVLLLTGVPVTLYALAGWSAGELSSSSVWAIALLYLSIVPSSFSEAVNSVLNGFERMDLAAILNIGVGLIRAPLAVALGASRLGVPGVALAALLSALVSAAVFGVAGRAASGAPTRWRFNTAMVKQYATESWPLLVNALLISLFFRADVFIVQAWRGDQALGVYDAAYKLINLLTIVPSYVVLAVFPLMARRADDPPALTQAQRSTSWALVVVAWVSVVVVQALADLAIRVLAGNAYLPEAATLLRILIWFAPLSFVNGVIQYVLVAGGEQRKVVPAFVAAVVFNLCANLLTVPVWGARASATITVLTEVVIIAAFWAVTRRSRLPVVDRALLMRVWRPSAAGIIAAACALLVPGGQLPALAGALAAFALAVAVLRAIGPEDRVLIGRALRRA